MSESPRKGVSVAASEALDPEESAAAAASAAAAFPIVGVGASAGGLEALLQLLRALPADTGMAFVLVQHLAPSHPSALAEILSRATAMPVAEVTGEPKVEPNHVYVIPPGQNMIIAGGVLHLQPRTGLHRPVDLFFRSLADDRRHRAIGVILSGTASDGTLGLQAIKAEGGITFAQDTTAQQSGMPQSAIDSGCVDFVQSPEQIAQEIVRISRHPYAAPEAVAEQPAHEPGMDQVIRLLHRDTGVDFTDYKPSTLHRRITRRMVLKKKDQLADYAGLLSESPAELQALYQDILINVTSFFRDPEAFTALQEKVFPRLVEDRSPHEPVRVWTIGCSTGQEAYSLAMAWTEFAESMDIKVPLQLFATDLNEVGVNSARTGIFPLDIALDLSPERLRRFFVEVDGQYRIVKKIRDACVFSRHNILADPPLSRLDLISCRNVLIYLQQVLQQRILPTVHYGLKPTGFLWLGSSESIGTFRHLFDVTDAKHKIYARRPGSVTQPHHFPPQHGAARTGRMPAPAGSGGGALEVLREADRVLITRFAPPGVIVSADLDILQYRGDTGAYLAPAPGKASLNLLKMLRDGLVGGVRGAVLRAGREQVRVREEGLRVKSADGYREVAVDVFPLKVGASDEEGRGAFLIVFDDGAWGRGAGAIREPAEPVPSDPDRGRLAKELADTSDYLQAVIEQQEVANEELQSANEEVQSSNEELQSINEELETSKEELQSSNEELATVNDELSNRNTELGQLNDDLGNLIGSIHTPIVMLGMDLRVRRFTPAAERLFSLTLGDLGRPIGDIKLRFDVPDLETLLRDVLDTSSGVQREVRDSQGRWYSMRLRPYRTVENRVDGVVMMLLDIDLLKRAHEYTKSILQTVRGPLIVLDANLRVRTANDSFYQTFRVQPQETEGRLLYELGGGEWDFPRLRELLEEILPGSIEFQNLEVEQEFAGIGTRTLVLNARRLVQESDGEASILLAIEDITEFKRTEKELRQNAADIAEADRHKTEFLALLAHELRNPLSPIRNALIILQRSGGDTQTLLSATGMMERQVAQMVRLVDDLLDVSRISRGKLELRPGRVDLSSLIRDATEACRPVCESLDQELVVALPPHPIYLDADPTRLTQIVGNLLSNASKFTERGGRIELTLERERMSAVLRVRDNGIGIAADQLPRIFDMFMQVDSSLERSSGGLGLGLTLVRSLVQLHHGTMEVDSPGIGGGSEFVVRLPIPDDSLVPPPEPEAAAPAQVTPRRILVVDDNQDSAVSLALLLRMSGNDLHTVADGPAALEAAERLRPEVVLLDIGLPGMNGYDVARKIRQQPWGSAMTLVALTGWGQDEDREKSRAAGFDAHLVKPVDYAALMKMLAEVHGGGG